MLSKIYLSENKLSVEVQLSTNNTTLLSDFEIDIEKYYGFSNKVAVLNSGTSSLHLALILAGVKQNDEVLCQSFTFSASANPIVYQGAKPVFIDSEKDTWNMCPEFLEDAIKNRIVKNKKPKAIIVVHLYGMPAKIDLIVEIAKKYNIALIEDAAEALGSMFKGQKCGAFGDFGILSFNSNKIITLSSGGALVCNTEENKQKAIFLATQARDNTIHYQHSEVGYNYRMSNVIAGIGISQMKCLEDNITSRRSNNQFYSNLFNNYKGIEILKKPNQDYFSNHWLSCIVIDSDVTRFTSEDLRLQLKKDNIESRPLWKPMHLQPVFKDCDYYGSNVAENLFEKGLCLPSGSNLTDVDRARIANSISKLL